MSYQIAAGSLCSAGLKSRGTLQVQVEKIQGIHLDCASGAPKSRSPWSWLLPSSVVMDYEKNISCKHRTPCNWQGISTSNTECKRENTAYNQAPSIAMGMQPVNIYIFLETYYLYMRSHVSGMQYEACKLLVLIWNKSVDSAALFTANGFIRKMVASRTIHKKEHRFEAGRNRWGGTTICTKLSRETGCSRCWSGSLEGSLIYLRPVSWKWNGYLRNT